MSAELEEKKMLLYLYNKKNWALYKDPSHISKMKPANFDKMVEKLVRDWLMYEMRVSQPSPAEKIEVNEKFKRILRERSDQFVDAMAKTNSNREEALAILERNHSEKIGQASQETKKTVYPQPQPEPEPEPDPDPEPQPVSKAETLQPSAPPAELLSDVGAAKNAPTIDNFTRVRVDGDGDCLFASALQATGRERSKIKDLRNDVANWIRANKDIDLGSGLTPAQVIDHAEGVNFDTYIEGIKGIKGKKYGGDLEIRAISSLLGINIVVYYPRGTVPKPYFYSNGSETIYLVNSGRQRSGGEHYDFLNPKGEIHITDYMDPAITEALKAEGNDVENDDLIIRVILSSINKKQAFRMLKDISGKDDPRKLAERAKQAAQEEPEPDPKVLQLVGLGFDLEAVQMALRDTGGDVEQAAIILYSAADAASAARLKPKRTKKRRKKKKSSGKRKKPPAKKKKQTAKKKKRTERR